MPPTTATPGALTAGSRSSARTRSACACRSWCATPSPRPRHAPRPGLNIDYAELIAELTGALPDPGVEGRSLKRLLCGIDKTWRTDILNEHWNGTIPTNAQVRGVFG